MVKRSVRKRTRRKGSMNIRRRSRKPRASRKRRVSRRSHKKKTRSRDQVGGMLGIQGAPPPARNRLEDKLSSERARLEQLNFPKEEIDEIIDRLRGVLTTGVEQGDQSLNATGGWDFDIDTISIKQPHTRAYNYTNTKYPNVHCSWRGPYGDTHCKRNKVNDAIGYFNSRFQSKQPKKTTREAWKDWKKQFAPWVIGSEEGGGPVTGDHASYPVHPEAVDRKPGRYTPM